MSKQIDLVSYRAELQRKLEAVNELLGVSGGRAYGRRAYATRTAARGPGRSGQRKMSAAGRARLAAIARARWRKARLAGKSRL